MCGIAGYIGQYESFPRPEGLDILNRMMTRIRHRGPDHCGLYLEGGTGLGNVRLSIIDLLGGAQPLSNAKGSMWIVYNGEVYNYKELKADLVKRGHVFKTQCDTEVVLHMYEEYGWEALNYLNGQFAFAIWDTIKKECFFARDRMGIRPLYYTIVNGTMVFGSEIKSLFEFPRCRRVFSAEAFKEVFTFWATLTPNTIFKDVYELEPGQCAWYRHGRIETKKYWSFGNHNSGEEFKGSFMEALEQFKNLFADSVSLRLRSDVPVAAYLSGGLDSSTTTFFIKDLAPRNLNTFSIGFSDNSFNETEFQQEVSSYLNTDHKSICCTAQNIAEWFPKVVWHAEIPILRSSPAPMLGLSKLVHDEGIKVVITGEGADEAFAGYNIFKETIIRRFWSRIPSSKIRPLLLKRLYPYIPSIRHASPGILRMFFGYKLEDVNSPVYSHVLRWQNTSNIQKLFSEDLRRAVNTYLPIEHYSNSIRSEINGFSPLSKAQYIESTIFMSGYLLSSQGDRMSMANSVEGRYPFLDHRILDFAISLPDDFKLKGFNEKYILKELMKDKLPNSIVGRSKQAYRAPVMESFLGSDAPEYVADSLSRKMIEDCNIFDFDQVSSLLKKIKYSELSSEVDSMALVGILSTQLLFQSYIQNFDPLKEWEILEGETQSLLIN